VLPTVSDQTRRKRCREIARRACDAENSNEPEPRWRSATPKRGPSRAVNREPVVSRGRASINQQRETVAMRRAARAKIRRIGHSSRRRNGTGGSGLVSSCKWFSDQTQGGSRPRTWSVPPMRISQSVAAVLASLGRGKGSRPTPRRASSLVRRLFTARRGGSSSIDVREFLPVRIGGDEAFAELLDRPGRREAAGRHCAA
jgi:hypothetical protein